MVIIGVLFGICCAMLYGLAMLTGTSYNDISVVINVFVEPILCVMMMTAALLSILKKEQAKIAFNVFKYTVWGLLVIGIISLAYGGYWLNDTILKIPGFSYDQTLDYDAGQWSAFAHKVEVALPAGIYSHNAIFTGIRDILVNMSGRMGMSYEALNIIIYVIAELIALAMFYTAYKLKKRNVIYFVNGTVFFIVSVIPTLCLLST